MKESRMKKILLLGLISIVVLNACVEDKSCVEQDLTQDKSKTVYDTLRERASQNVDSSKWDMDLFKQDLELYQRIPDIFDGLPLTKSPFPVAYYDYAVSSVPMKIEVGKQVIKGVRIGEFENPDSDKVIDKLTLLILTENIDADDNVLVESRNYPYLTAQGTFQETHSKYDWIFTASPDGFSALFVNMKLFDLRFGETVIIYPQSDKSFLYDQIDDSPNNYKNVEDYKIAISKNRKVLNQLNSMK